MDTNKLALAVIALLWWVAMWGLIELSIEDFTKKQRFIVFISFLGIVIILLQIFPHALNAI